MSNKNILMALRIGDLINQCGDVSKLADYIVGEASKEYVKGEFVDLLEALEKEDLEGSTLSEGQEELRKILLEYMEQEEQEKVKLSKEKEKLVEKAKEKAKTLATALDGKYEWRDSFGMATIEMRIPDVRIRSEESEDFKFLMANAEYIDICAGYSGEIFIALTFKSDI